MTGTHGTVHSSPDCEDVSSKAVFQLSVKHHPLEHTALSQDGCADLHHVFPGGLVGRVTHASQRSHCTKGMQSSRRSRPATWELHAEASRFLHMDHRQCKETCGEDCGELQLVARARSHCRL